MMLQIFDVNDALAFGLPSAIIIDILKEFPHGWTVKEIMENCPYISEKKIRKTLKELMDLGIIVAKKSSHPMDHTVRYYLWEEEDEG